MWWRQLRWAAAITRDCLSTITGGWRLSIRRMASIWGRKICKPPISMPSVQRACGWAFRLMTIWRSTSRWRHVLLYRAGTCVSDTNQTDAFAPQGLEQLARHVERLADYPTVAIGGYQSGARACGDSNGCRQYRRRQRHYQAADWRLATAQLLEIAGSWR